MGKCHVDTPRPTRARGRHASPSRGSGLLLGPQPIWVAPRPHGCAVSDVPRTCSFLPSEQRRHTDICSVTERFPRLLSATRFAHNTDARRLGPSQLRGRVLLFPTPDECPSPRWPCLPSSSPGAHPSPRGSKEPLTKHRCSHLKTPRDGKAATCRPAGASQSPGASTIRLPFSRKGRE